MQPREQNPQFTNPLKGSASAYLRQHAHNPVYWEPWGEAALARAKKEDRPILVSIGYASCYWCHVMEREVFENPSIAAVMNKHFICIKIDREEHPALDEIYMVARQLMTRQGGWPNHVWLTPDLKPFFAGGTFGASEAYGRPGFAQVLESIHEAWVNQRETIEAQAEELLRATRHFLEREKRGDSLPDIAALAGRLAEQLLSQADSGAGGFYNAPKFPHESYLSFLLAYAKREKNTKALETVMQALYAMAAGGLYDQVGGGFHRYAVDRNWQVPHFEKMIYNQALLARVYTQFAVQTQNLYAKHVALGVLDSARAVFAAPGGGFYSAIDAENDGVEGAYYAWTKAELEALLSREQMAFLMHYYFLAEIPHFPGHKPPSGKVLNARRPLPVAAEEEGRNYLELAGLSAEAMNKLLAARNHREPPLADDKILTGSNGLMITAFAEVYTAFGRVQDYDTAAQTARFLLKNARLPQGYLAHMVALGKAHHAAGLEDYAYFVEALLALHRADKNAEWLQAATVLMEEAHERLWDEARGGYFSVVESGDMLLRPRHAEDSALPSPNAIMLRNLYALGLRTGEGRYAARAQALALAFAPSLALNTTDIALPEYAAFLEVLMEGESLPEGAGGEAVQVSLSLAPGAAKPGEECEVRIHVKIQEGWHLNAHRPSFEFLVPTVVKVEGPGIGSIQRIDYPPPVIREFRPGESLAVYEGNMTITAFVTLALTPQGNRKPIRVRLACQPCRETSCLPPVGVDASI